MLCMVSDFLGKAKFRKPLVARPTEWRTKMTTYIYIHIHIYIHINIEREMRWAHKFTCKSQWSKTPHFTFIGELLRVFQVIC